LYGIYELNKFFEYGKENEIECTHTAQKLVATTLLQQLSTLHIAIQCCRDNITKTSFCNITLTILQQYFSNISSKRHKLTQEASYPYSIISKK